MDDDFSPFIGMSDGFDFATATVCRVWMAHSTIQRVCCADKSSGDVRHMSFLNDLVAVTSNPLAGGSPVICIRDSVDLDNGFF